MHQATYHGLVGVLEVVACGGGLLYNSGVTGVGMTVEGGV